MISICVTCALEPEPEKLARTWSPSLMSESDAVCPFFVTCVLGLSLSCSESWLLFLSNFWTLPVTSVELDEDAVEPIEDPEPVVSLEVEPPIVDPPVVPEPVVPEPVVEPLEPVPPYDEPLEPFDDGSVVVSLELPLEPEPIEPEPVEPLDPLDPEVCAHAGTPATSSPAVPRPATTPHPIFIRLPPCCCSVRDGPGTLPWHVVLAPIR
jgi:hypothetical protein